MSMLLGITTKVKTGLRVDLFYPYHDIYTKNTVTSGSYSSASYKGRGSYLSRPYGSRGGRWLPVFLGSPCPAFASIQVFTVRGGHFSTILFRGKFAGGSDCLC